MAVVVVCWLFATNSLSAVQPSNAQNIQRNSFGNLSPHVTHEIELGVKELPQGQIAYEMNKYVQRDANNQTTDITSNYSNLPTLPGPTLIVTEGDRVKITLVNDMEWGSPSVHTHGVHYKITSDGTVKDLNQVSDQAASPNNTFTYEWDAAEGTAGSWPFHDHTLAKNSFGMNMNGLETVGLFSSIIVNPANGKVDALINGTPTKVNVKDIDKEFVLSVNDDVFWGTEIDHSNGGKHTPLWVNPTLVAANNETVRFNIQSLGNEFHNFTMDNVKWLKPGTNDTINSHIIGPLANHVFTVSADKNATYFDTTEINLLGGMKGNFVVNPQGGASIPGESPL
jgi:manganese oxidase